MKLDLGGEIDVRERITKSFHDSIWFSSKRLQSYWSDMLPANYYRVRLSYAL